MSEGHGNPGAALVVMLVVLSGMAFTCVLTLLGERLVVFLYHFFVQHWK